MIDDTTKELARARGRAWRNNVLRGGVTVAYAVQEAAGECFSSWVSAGAYAAIVHEVKVGLGREALRIGR